MRFIHTADWHLGRCFHNAVLTGDQTKLLLEGFLPLVREEKAEAVVIAGDIFDRGVPPVEAVQLFDEVLIKLRELEIPVLYIAGNHDSAIRLGFGSRLLAEAGVHVRGRVSAGNAPVVLEDKHGPVYFALLPYVEPLQVRRLYGIDEARDFDAANRLLAGEIQKKIPARTRSVAVAHAFLAGGKASDSERLLSVGGADRVAPGSFKGFSFTALGHLHNSQAAGAENIRYSGSLMKYSFAEEKQQKGVNVVELDAEGKADIRFMPLAAPHDMRSLHDSFTEILSNRDKYPASQDYLEVVLTDRGIIPNAMSRLREVFPNTLNVRQEERAVTGAGAERSGREMLRKDETELFAEFYEEMAGVPLTEEQLKLARECIREVQQEERER